MFNPELPLGAQHIDNSFYRVSDKVAGKLAKDGPLGRLPNEGMEGRVFVGNTQWWLTRTPYRYRTDSPARGWVWAVYGPRPRSVCCDPEPARIRRDWQHLDQRLLVLYHTTSLTHHKSTHPK